MKDIMMKKTLLITLLMMVLTTVSAEPLVVENFDSTPVGTRWKMWDRWNNPVSSTATVIADPANSSNHVLKVTVKGWNCFPEFNVPVEYKGAKILDRFKTIRFRLYRPNSDTNDYKQLHVFYGSDVQYDDNGGYPYQGDRNVWQQRQYDIVNVPASSTATTLHLGIHCDVSEYYIDDIMLYGEFDDYVTVASGKIDMSGSSSSSAYKSYTTPTYIPKDTKLDITTSRYFDLYAPLAGEGTLNIYSGGERTYLGEHANKKYQDWGKFTGDVHVYPYKSFEASNGFYGLVMGTNGKTFSPEDIDNGINEGKACNALANNRVFLHNGATIAFENGTRGAIFGELNTEAGSRIEGYYKSSSTAGSYLIVGTMNTDAVMAGTIAPVSTDKLGLIKDGTGTYTITANNNSISGGIRIRSGRVNISNDASAAEKSKLSGGTGTPAGNAPAVYVFGKGVLGGTGNIAGVVDLYGTLEPGTTEPGTLRIKDFVSNKSANIVMHPDATLRFKINSAEAYDQLFVNNALIYSTATELIGVTSDAKPRIRVVLSENDNVKVGDTFTVLTVAGSLDLANKWKMLFPTRYTWKAEEVTNDNGTCSLMLTVTSLKDDPDNANNDKEGEDIIGEDEKVPEHFGADGDTKSWREYADEKGLRIGVAIATYRTPLDQASDSRTAIARREYNMVVNENELKWESCEPSQNNFEYGGGEGLLYFANNNKMYMRGHTLAWHSQVAQWVSTDGKKNDKGWTKAQLMAILKNHVQTVVKHFKGRIGEWDVVNECLDDDQSIVRTNPNGYKLRASSIWTTVCGESFIDSAFVWARQADPTVKLYLNDYDNETLGKAKTQAFYNLAKRLKESGIPIDGVGFQCHLNAGAVDAPAIGKNIERFAPLGLECAITELDLGISGNTEENLQLQARDYYRIVKTAMEQPHCRSVLIWGLTDDLSWRSSNPLPWNGSAAKKPAYYGVRQALKDAVVVSTLKGDVDGDGAVTIADANMILNYVLGNSQTMPDLKIADMDGDGKVTKADADAVVRIYLGNN